MTTLTHRKHDLEAVVLEIAHDHPDGLYYHDLLTLVQNKHHTPSPTFNENLYGVVKKLCERAVLVKTHDENGHPMYNPV